ncbi:MAG: MOSC N-terminal beta barrel domain-containing protein [Casimicrobiaceae bacterium]
MGALHLYPVKGCRGIALAEAEGLVTGLACGLLRDRGWMVVDRHDRFVTQREHPRLALVETSLAGGALRLTAPGASALDLVLDAGDAARDVVVWNSRVRGFDQGDDAAAWFGALLGTELRLVRFDPATPRRCNPDYAGDSGAHTLFADGYPLLVIGEASLVDLNERLAAKGSPALPMNRFRPNIVVAGLPPHEEDHLDTLTCDGLTLKLVKPCTRCQVTTTDQATARVGIEPLATLSTYRRNDALAAVTFGMNAIVVAGAGRPLSVDAPVTVTYRF